MSESSGPEPRGYPAEFEREFEKAVREVAYRRTVLRRWLAILLIPIALAIWIYLAGFEERANLEAVQAFATPETQRSLARLAERDELLSQLHTWVASARTLPPLERLDRVAELADEVESLKAVASAPPEALRAFTTPDSQDLLARAPEVLAFADAIGSEGIDLLSDSRAGMRKFQRSIDRVESAARKEEQERTALEARVKKLESQCGEPPMDPTARVDALQKRVLELEVQVEGLRARFPPKL